MNEKVKNQKIGEVWAIVNEDSRRPVADPQVQGSNADIAIKDIVDEAIRLLE